MKLTFTLATLATLFLTATALPSPTIVNGLGERDSSGNVPYDQTPNCTPAAGVATDGNQYWADNCDDGAGEDGFGQ